MSRSFRRAVSDCAVASFAGRVATWLDISKIIFVNRATEVLSACVSVARFTNARVWSYCISVKSTALACAACTFAEYPAFLEVLDDLWVYLKARAK